jgi:hypothetical protein
VTDPHRDLDQDLCTMVVFNKTASIIMHTESTSIGCF